MLLIGMVRSDESSRTRALLAELITWVGQRAVVDGQAAAADAAGEVVAELLETVNSLVQRCLPASGQSLPVGPGGGAAIRQLGKGRADVCQGDADALCDADKGHAAKHLAPVASLVAGGAPAADKTLSLVEVQCRDAHTAAGGDLANGELRPVPCGLLHSVLQSEPRRLDLKVS